MMMLPMFASGTTEAKLHLPGKGGQITARGAISREPFEMPRAVPL